MCPGSSQPSFLLLALEKQHKRARTLLFRPWMEFLAPDFILAKLPPSPCDLLGSEAEKNVAFSHLPFFVKVTLKQLSKTKNASTKQKHENYLGGYLTQWSNFGGVTNTLKIFFMLLNIFKSEEQKIYFQNTIIFLKRFTHHPNSFLTVKTCLIAFSQKSTIFPSIWVSLP